MENSKETPEMLREDPETRFMRKIAMEELLQKALKENRSTGSSQQQMADSEYLATRYLAELNRIGRINNER
jgi:hypothetical protein